MLSPRAALIFGLSMSGVGPAACYDPSDASPDSGTTGGTDVGDGSGGSSDDHSSEGTTTDASVDDTGDSGGDESTGGDTGGDEAAVSGDRLRRRDFSAEGGARVYRGLHDTELELDCAFQWSEDGSLRCLPEYPLKVAYADAGCTDPVFPDDTPSCTASYAYERTYVGACGEPSLYTMYAVDDGGSARSGTFYYQTSSGCFQAGTSTSLLPVQHMPAASFVAGVHDDVAREGGVVARFVAADDGARTIVELRDEARASVCQPHEGLGRCTPVRAAEASPPDAEWALFSDATCDTPVGIWSFDDPCPPDAIRRASGESCDALPEFFEVGAASDPSAVGQWNGTTCELLEGPWGPPFVVGAPIPSDTLPLVERGVEGDGRLQAWFDASSAGEPLSSGRGFVDTRTGGECRPAEFDDGSLRCVPTDAIIFSEFDTMYAEPGCTGDRVVHPFSCDPSPEYVLEIDIAQCIGERVRQAYAVGEPFDGTTVYADFGGGCEPLEVVAGEYLRLGDELSPSTFAALTETIE